MFKSSNSPGRILRGHVRLLIVGVAIMAAAHFFLREELRSSGGGAVIKASNSLKLPQLLSLIAADSQALLVDIRPTGEFNAGSIPSAANIAALPASGHQDVVVIFGENADSPLDEAFPQVREKYTNSQILFYPAGWSEWRSSALDKRYLSTN